MHGTSLCIQDTLLRPKGVPISDVPHSILKILTKYNIALYWIVIAYAFRRERDIKLTFMQLIKDINNNHRVQRVP